MAQKLSFVGPINYLKSITAHEIVYPTGTSLSIGSGVIVQGTITATGTGAIRMEVLTGCTVTATAVANLDGAGPSELVIDGAITSDDATSTQDALCTLFLFAPSQTA